MDIPVAWGDLDAFGHVNNTVYVRWCESVRIAYFQRAQLWNGRPGQGVGPILARIAVDYRTPVLFPGTVRAEATVSRFGKTSFEMKYRIHRALSPGTLVAEADSVIVMFDYPKGEKVALSSEMKSAIEALEASAG